MQLLINVVFLFNKAYTSEKERLNHYSYFVSNLKEVEYHNANYPARTSYTKGINKFTDLNRKFEKNIARIEMIF